MEIDGADIQKDLRRTRINKAVYLLAGVGLSGLGAALLVIFVAGGELPAILLSVVAFIWSALLFNQYRKTRRIVRAMESRLVEMDAGGGANGAMDRTAGELLETGEGGGGESAEP